MTARSALYMPALVALTLAAAPASAMTGAEVMKMLNHDNDQTLEIPEVIDAATKLFSEIDQTAIRRSSARKPKVD